MKAITLSFVLAFACPSMASAQSSIIDLSKPTTGPAQFVVGSDGQPVERGVPAKVETRPPATTLVGSKPDEATAPIIRPWQLAKPDARTASFRPSCGANDSDACSSGTSRRVRINVVLNEKAAEKPKSVGRFRIGRRR